MQTLFFGPQRNSPSWSWVGKDIAQHLTANFHIKFFNHVEDIADGSVVFWIKHPPPESDVQLLRSKRLRVIYFPVDQYQNEAELAQGQSFIDSCSLLACHTEGMAELFKGKHIEFVDHYNKYGIDPTLRAPSGRYLWIGGYQYVPYLYSYLQRAKLPFEIDILTDYRNPASILAANQLAHQLNLDIDLPATSYFPGLQLIEWSEDRQRTLLLSCEGAFDYKHVSDFNQRYKPPTKVQKYVASGIPTAVNHDSASFKQMQAWGMELCDPTQVDLWRSAGYRADIKEYSEKLAQRITISAISSRYIEFAGLLS